MNGIFPNSQPQSWVWVARATSYRFRVYTPDTYWNDVGGVYIFARLVGALMNQRFVALYVGRTQSFRERLRPDHDGWACAEQRGASHIHALVADENSSAAIERTLIEVLNPPCNTQYTRSF